MKTFRIVLFIISFSLILATLPAIVKAPGSDASAGVPTNVTLTTSAATVATGSAATLTATADDNVSGSGYTIQIWRVSPGTNTRMVSYDGKTITH